MWDSLTRTLALALAAAAAIVLAAAVAFLRADSASPALEALSRPGS